MGRDQLNQQLSDWKEYEKILFRFFFIYFFLQVFPLDWKFYRHLFSINWLSPDISDIFNIAKYTPQFISGHYDAVNWGLATFADWGFIALVALAGTVAWSLLDKTTKNYTRLYYELRVLVRYRLAVAVIAYGFLKLFDVQAPAPSVSSLNTPYGDLTTWKIFSLSLGIVPGYQSFLGAVELLAGIALLCRKTAPIGATIIIFFIGNVFMSNLAYEGGEIVYSFYLVVLALFLVAYDLPRIIDLLVLNVPVAPSVVPVSWTRQQGTIRLVLKSAVVLVFVFIYGFGVYRSATKGGYHFATHKGVKGLNGLYTVTSFEVSGRSLPYSLTDTVRWQDVVFEKWATLSIKINKNYHLVNYNTEDIPAGKEESSFEQAGTVGRVYYDYKADTTGHVLNLINKTPEGQSLQLKYDIQPDKTILLSGLVNGDTIRAVLEKNNKKYLLKTTPKGRRSSLKL
jgi:hypothetical protein